MVIGACLSAAPMEIQKNKYPEDLVLLYSFSALAQSTSTTRSTISPLRLDHAGKMLDALAMKICGEQLNHLAVCLAFAALLPADEPTRRHPWQMSMASL